MDKKLDKPIQSLANRMEIQLLLFKRFLDDLFFLFIGSSKQLHQLFEEINQIHHAIKFTMTHTSPEGELKTKKCDCIQTKSIQFLDTSCHIKNGKIEVDLSRKSTDRNQYLLPSSCHPKTTSANIPFSLSLRIIRTCTNSVVRDKRLEDLKELLLARDYPEKLINSAAERAKKIPRKVALKEKKQKKNP